MLSDKPLNQWTEADAAAFVKETNRDQLLAQADQAEIDGRHARLAAQDVKNPSDRDYALCVARQHEQRAWGLRKLAWVS